MKTAKLANIADIQTGPFGSQLHKEDYVDAGTPIVTVEHLGRRKLSNKNVPFVSESDAHRLSKYSLEQGDIVFSRVGSVDRCSQVSENEAGWLFSGRCLRVRPNDSMIDPDYLYYFLTLPKTQEFIRAIAVGATMPSINTSLLGEVDIDLPPLSEQVGIAKGLGALDDKIAANSRIIKIATHLNINLVEKAVTKELEHLQNLADITMGSSPKGEFLNEEGIGEPFFQGVRDFGELFPSERVFAEKAVRTAQEGDILFAVRAPIGEVNIAERPCVIGRGIAAIRGKQSHLGLFYLLKGHPELWETYKSSGTVFAGINKSDLHNAVIPVLRDSEKLEQQLTPIHERAMHALRESQALARTRDELLPLLMSGRITVGEAEDAADEAASES
ncbi:restriction endonuclease subunit S [Corynebacterium tuberculostearicum]|uniref:restriction endonuclease subunit S n=1 Tax=Corynebacterium tuberculostearicum TaxID=38304 RepID=UPI002934D3F9|nr:restriction endonuclease subunit S [Corynebacterium tuberculostearicum]MDV2428301.1 restriction endonuclease subunit S [Corynebacterium tuberculostearicum]